MDILVSVFVRQTVSDLDFTTIGLAHATGIFMSLTARLNTIL